MIILNSNGAKKRPTNRLANEKQTSNFTATIVLYKPENEWLEVPTDSEKVVVGSTITGQGSMTR